MSDVRFRVHGTITGEDGRELSDAAVAVWHQRIRSRDPLAKGRADEEGRYCLEYEPPDDDVPGRLLVVVTARSRKPAASVESAILEAQRDQQVDLAVEPRDTSEYATLRRAIVPLLDGLDVDDLVEDDEHHDISFLAQDTARSPEEITRVAIAARLGAAYDLPAVAFYAFLRQRVPSALPSPLLEATQKFELIDPLVQRIGSLIFALAPDIQTRTLEAAVEQQFVGRLSKQIPEIVQALQARRVADVLDQPYLLGKGTLRELLETAGLPAAKHAAFAEALATNTLSLRNFWRTLGDGAHGFTPKEASKVQRSLELGAFAKNHLPLVEALLLRFQTGSLGTLADLASLSVDDWTQLVREVGAPANVDGAGDEGPEEVFAKVIYTRVTRTYPTAALSARIVTSEVLPPPDRAQVARFFANNRSLELRKTSISTYLEQAGDAAFKGIGRKQRATVVEHAKRLQRVLRVTPDADAAEAVLKLGIHSATQIATMGRQQFFTKATGAGLTKREANRIYDVGAQRYAGLVGLFTQMNRGFVGLWPGAVGSTAELDDPTAEVIRRDQSLATLFGSQDYCASEECTSVLSPAAYLCDLLLWLRNHPLAGAYPTALAALFDRRPDLGHLLLNCPNTDVALPYIDLVNELLEDAVSPPMAPVWKQTTRTAAELRAAPEYVNAAAYTTLAAASYPHTLPYDKPLDEVRTYLALSGVTLWQLRDALRALQAPTLPQRLTVAAERFGIDPHETDLISNPNFVAATVAWNTADPANDLVPVTSFLHAATITYEQLLELLEVVWVRGGGAPLTLAGVDDTCDLTRQTLAPAPLDAGVLDRLHRFLRLWRHGGWTMWELDLLLAAPAVANGTLDERGLVTLFEFRRLQDLTGLPVDRQLAFFQPIDGATHRNPDGSRTTSLYAGLFLDPSVPADADLAALATGGAVVDNLLAHHLPAVQSALGVSADDAATLFALTDGTLTLANLSELYRVVELARAVRLSLDDLTRVVPLTTAGSLAAALADPAATLAFIQQVRDIERSGFSVDGLVYVLTTQLTTTGITTDQITTGALPAVRTAMQRTHDEIFTSADPPLVILQRELAQLPQFTDAAVLATAISIVDDSYADTLAHRNAFIAANVAGFMDVATAQADLAPLPGGLTPAQVQAAVDQRAGDLLNPLAVYLTQTRVIAAVAAGVQLQADVTALLMEQLELPASTTTLLAALTDPALITQPYLPITPANFPGQYLALHLLDKVGAVVRRLHLVHDDLSWLLENAAIYGGLDLTQVPVTGAQPDLTIAALLATSLLVKLDRTFVSAPPAAPIRDLYALITAVSNGALATEAATQDALATIAGATTADVAALSAQLGLVFPADYTAPGTYDALRTLLAIAAAAGGSGPQLVAWGAAAPDETTATSAQAALKARYSESDWLKVAATLTDPIRERRSAALQAYLLAQRDGGGGFVYGDTNALFEHFLIDVEMSSCEVTARVVQAYAAVQLFVERCLMGLEEPGVIVDLTRDDTWTQWRFMKRYRIWEAARQVFLYPENWLIESQRPNRTEIFQKLEQEVHQNDSTADYLETVALNYIDRLDELAHLTVTGTCVDPRTGAIHVVARTAADPPRFYHRTFADRTWSGWEQIPLDIKAYQVVPAVYRRRLCLFWPDVKVVAEPRQPLPAAQASTSTPSDPAKYVSIGLDFSIFRNGHWSPPQKSRGRLFDVPVLTSNTVSNSTSVEALYTLKVQAPLPSPGFGSSLQIDVFRLGDYDVQEVQFWFVDLFVPNLTRPNAAVQIGRAVFDGRFSDLELRNLNIVINLSEQQLLTHAQNTYGPDAIPLLPLPEAQSDPDLVGEPGLVPQAGALATIPPNTSSTLPLVFTSIAALEQNVGPLLATAQTPFRVVGPDSDLTFDPSAYFFYQDTRRCYFVESVRYYQWGSAWLPTPPSDPASAPFEVRYAFRRFYHPYTRLFWHQLSGGGFDALYARALQLSPDTIDPSGADIFSFSNTYHPVLPRVSWGENNEIVDFAPDAAYSVYNWELFFHAPLYIAERLSQNQQFEDALAWFHYLFDPTRSGPEPVPERFWIPKPLNALTSAAILQQRINNLLLLVNQGDPNAVAQVTRWRRDPFNPFLLADQRPVAYMKRVVMSYLDNLIAWADNLFTSDSREALNEATLLYVIAAEILGPQPVGVTPPQHVDESYDDLEPKLDAFANALVDIENVVDSGGGGGGGDGTLPAPQTFYFKIPPNQKLLGYWTTVADRLFKLRHCQNIEGVTRQLALFDAPIDPGLLVQAQAAGVDIGSVISDLQAPRPGYRFVPLYAQALEFCGAVREYGGKLLAALERSDAEALSLLLANQQLQLSADADQVLQARVDEAQKQIDALQQTLALAQAKFDDADTHPWANDAEATSLAIKSVLVAGKLGVAVGFAIAGGLHLIPNFALGVAGFGGSPAAEGAEGGDNAGNAAKNAAKAGEVLGDALDKGAELAKTVGEYLERADDNKEKAKEAAIEKQRTQAEIAAAQIRLAIAQQEQANHQTQADRLQQQIDFLTTGKFTNQDLYDWMVGVLADTYFQSYRLAYRLCQQVERCYRYELGLTASSFIRFGYWDSLKKGLLAGESLSHDVRRMQASYVEQNARRFETSRYLSLAALDPHALLRLLETGSCTFDLPESLFDGDYPGHYQRRLVRVSVTVVYPEPGRYDNVKGTLTLTKNSVRMVNDLGAGYPRQAGADPRFADQFGAVPQRIVLGNARDDPGLFLTAIDENLSDPRYLPFEGAGAISSWHLELPAETNDIDLATVADVVLHLYYTSLDGGDSFKQAVEADNAANAPNAGILLLSSTTDFPDSAWQRFLAGPGGGGDQELTLNVSASKFPRWARGKTVTVTGLTVFATSQLPGNFLLVPQAPLPGANVNLTPVAGVTEPNVVSGVVGVVAESPGTWTFKLRTAAAADFRSITVDDVADVLLLITFQAA